MTVTVLSSVADISLPKSIAPIRVRSRNNNVELRKARCQVLRAHHKFGKYSSLHSAAIVRLCRTHAFMAEKHAMAIIDDIQSQIYERRTAAAWKSINEFCGRKSTLLSCIKASSIDQIKEKPQQHYANVLSRRPPPLPISDDDDVITVTPDLDSSNVTGPIITTELRAALSTSKLSSSSGTDGIPVITLRIKDNILNTINQSSKMVDSEYNIPSQWKHSIIVSIAIKGSSLSLDKQRGIAKSCAISKLRNKILFHGVKSVTETKLLGLQIGFHSGRSTMEQIMMFCFLLDTARTQKRSLTVVVVDYGKAFDSVDRRAILVVHRHYGVPDLFHRGCDAVVSWFHRNILDPLLTYRNVRYHQWCSTRGCPVASPLYHAGRLHSQTITR